jgi:hypothetical protein
MKPAVARRVTLVLALIAALASGLAACSPDPNNFVISPRLGEQLAAAQAGQEVVRAEPTAAPKLADLTPEQVTAGAAPELVTALGTADAARGLQLAQANGCVGCHNLDPNVPGAGPTWYNIGNTAVSRVPGESPVAYLDHSIVNSGAYIVPGFQDGIMPKNFGEKLSIQDQADIITYLLQQVGE